MEVFSATWLGSRSTNQDRWIALPDRGLFAVADGVGGGRDGELAATIAIEALDTGNADSDNIPVLFKKAHQEIKDTSVRRYGDAVMGTTLTALCLQNELATIIHSGDSRCYLLEDGCLRCLTQDHEAYDEELGGPVLSSYLGISSQYGELEIQRETFQISPGMLLLLCTDGLYRQVSDTKLQSIFMSHPSHPLEELVRKLGAEALHHEMSDNVTIVCVKV